MAMSSRVEDLKQHLEQNAENLSQSWEIRRSNLGGRGLFATKPIQKGILIFMNKPLAIGPRVDRNQDAFCSVCFEISESCEKCDKCFLMICSQNCKSARRHTEKCDFITTNWNLKETSTRELSEMLIYLDCLLLSSDQMSMLSWLQKSKFSNVYSSELKEFLAKNIIPEHQVEVINMIFTVLKINSFRVSANSQKKTVPLRALYPLSAFLNHSCIPNTRNVFNEEYSMAVYASRDIKPGEEIVTCYTGLLLCTPARRIQMYKTKRFWCNCERCSDVTEMGTRLSALKCLDKDCIGVLMPVTPLDPQCEWQCDNCSAIQSTARVSAIQGVLGSLVGALNLDDHLQLETFLLERLAVLIPYSNHIFVDMRLRLALNLGFVEDLKMIELSEGRLALKESLCRGTLRTAAALGAGDTHLRGRLLYHLHAALAERARRCPALYEELKPEIESTIEQAYSILQGDISAPPDLELRRRYLGPGCDKPQHERFFILDA